MEVSYQWTRLRWAQAEVDQQGVESDGLILNSAWNTLGQILLKVMMLFRLITMES